jgi:hypothetical protein
MSKEPSGTTGPADALKALAARWRDTSGRVEAGTTAFAFIECADELEAALAASASAPAAPRERSKE